jgi:serine protease Do
MEGHGMQQRRLLNTGLIAVTLLMGAVIGTVVSERVAATQEGPRPLVIPEPVELSNGFSAIAVDLGPAVVNIEVESAPVPVTDQFGDLFDFFGGPPPGVDPNVPEDPNAPTRRSTGSGFVVDAEGYIVTNNHVIDGALSIVVQFSDDTEFEATVVGTDVETDLAVIKIEVDRPLPIVKMGNSDAANAGDWVLALGSPFGFEQTLTAGIISAKGRNVPDSMQFQRFIQTDAAINPGNSGGPLVNMAGEVIGVNTAIISETRQFAGIGFAMPSNDVVDVYNQIITKGRVTRGWIGIQYRADNDALAAYGLDSGVVVTQVIAGGPAEAAGFESTDVIVEIQGQRIIDGDMLLDIVAAEDVGSVIPFVVLRSGEELALNVTIGDREEMNSAQTSIEPRFRGGREDGEEVESRLGIRVQAITRQVRSMPGGRDLEGVMVISVTPGSVAADAGLIRGLIITRLVAGGQFFDITDVDSFSAAEQELTEGMQIALLVRNANDEFAEAFLPMRVR